MNDREESIIKRVKEQLQSQNYKREDLSILTFRTMLGSIKALYSRFEAVQKQFDKLSENQLNLDLSEIRAPPVDLNASHNSLASIINPFYGHDFTKLSEIKSELVTEPDRTDELTQQQKPRMANLE